MESGSLLADLPLPEFDAIIIAVAHREYADFTVDDFKKWIKPDGILVDVKGLYRANT